MKMRCYLALLVLAMANLSFGVPVPKPQFTDSINFGGPIFFPPAFGALFQQLGQVASSFNELGTRFGSIRFPQQSYGNFAGFPFTQVGNSGFPDEGTSIRLGNSGVGAFASSGTGGPGNSFSSVAVSNSGNSGRPVAVSVTQQNNQRPFVQVSHFR